MRNHKMLTCICGKPNPIVRRNWAYYTFNCTCGIALSGIDAEDIKRKLRNCRV